MSLPGVVALTLVMALILVLILLSARCPKCNRVIPHRRGCPLGWRNER